MRGQLDTITERNSESMSTILVMSQMKSIASKDDFEVSHAFTNDDKTDIKQQLKCYIDLENEYSLIILDFSKAITINYENLQNVDCVRIENIHKNEQSFEAFLKHHFPKEVRSIEFENSTFIFLADLTITLLCERIKNNVMKKFTAENIRG
mmetsp:Transcript_17562/g.19761  ORF Transcript_17562/g.19761 Transcript_17562/m.19761 type:complete len:151 (+) Transcript_17562:177-629(+)